MCPFAIALALLSIASPPPCTSSLAPPPDERAFMASVLDLASLGSGHQAAFRFRMVEFDCQAGDGSATKIRDGALKLRYDSAAFLSEEIYCEHEAADGYQSVYRKRRAHRSLFSGGATYLLSSFPAVSDRAYVEYWNGMPPIYYYALGFLGPRFNESLKLHERRDAGELREAVYHAKAGSDEVEIVVTYDPARDGELRSMRSAKTDGTPLGMLSFSGFVPSGGGGPAHPTTITEIRYKVDGCLDSVTVWAELAGTWADAPISTEVARGTEIMDFRKHGITVQSTFVDRPLSIGELESWLTVSSTWEPATGAAAPAAEHDHAGHDHSAASSKPSSPSAGGLR